MKQETQPKARIREIDVQEIIEDLGKEIHRCQKEQRLTDAELAFYARVSTSTLHGIKGGKQGTLKSVISILAALDLDLHLKSVKPFLD